MLALCTDKASDLRIGVARLLIEMLFCLSFGEVNVATLVILPLAIVTATCTGPHRVSITFPSNVLAASVEAACGAAVAGAAVEADVTGVLATVTGAVVGAADFAVVIGVVAPVIGAAVAAGVVGMIGLAVAILAEVLPSVNANNALRAPVAVRLTARAVARLPRAAWFRFARAGGVVRPFVWAGGAGGAEGANRGEADGGVTPRRPESRSSRACTSGSIEPLTLVGTQSCGVVMLHSQVIELKNSLSSL